MSQYSNANSHNVAQSHFTRRQQKIQSRNIHRRLRISIAVLTAIICSFTVHSITTYNLKHSRNLHRSINSYVLQHSDLDIYWFGYRAGQYLINYPIHQYYQLGQFSLFLQRMEQYMGNFNQYSFGHVNQQQLNNTQYKILLQFKNGTYKQYPWRISDGLIQPFVSNDTQRIKQVLIDCLTMQIQVLNLSIYQSHNNPDSANSKWDIFFIIQPFSSTTIFATIYMQQKLYLGFKHIPYFLLGLATLLLILYQLRQRQHRRKFKATNRNDYLSHYTYRYILYKFKPSDAPDFLIAFFLLYTSIASLTKMFTLHYILILDGVTCLISWLYFLKLQTQNDDYHLSMLIKKSYILVGRLFISFGPMFIGFVLFALTAFCRYTVLFDNFHKSFISLFCVCYYNMTYQQYRTTQRANPISTIFFTSMIMIFTICTYSGMLVSVFCSYMWNKRQEKTKKQLMDSLKIQCTNCNTKYKYQEGYQSSIKKSMRKKQSYINQQQDRNIHNTHEFIKHLLHDKIYYLQHKLYQLLNSNQQIIQGFVKQGTGIQTQISKQYKTKLTKFVQQIQNIQKDLKLNVNK